MFLRRASFSTRAALFAFGFILWGCAFVHAAPLPTDESPAHPSAVLTEYNGDRRLVVAVDGRKPIVRLSDGSTRKLPRKVDYFLERAPAYHPGFVQVKEMELTGIVLVHSGSEMLSLQARGLAIPSWAVFHATLVSDVALKNCMVAILTINPDFATGISDDPHDNLVLNEIPDLKPGKPVRVKFNSVPITGYYFVLIFSDGREVRSDQLAPSKDFFRRTEYLKHRARVAQYCSLYAGQDHAVTPSIIIPPLRDDGTLLHLSGQPITAHLIIASDGTVEEASTNDLLDGPSRSALLRALRGWLFLPQLKAGVPVPTEITSPLQF